MKQQRAVACSVQSNEQSVQSNEQSVRSNQLKYKVIKRVQIEKEMDTE